ncbi:carbohydrate kinase family protein [Haploplasma axanthum]|nr:carbohydrate kinase [Haploplasma axanthum]
MKKIVSFGELLIDFIPHEKETRLKEVNNFTKHAGGAPANVSVAAYKNGSDSYFVGQVGNDSFGEFLIDELNNQGLNTNYILKTSEANTSLAFVTLAKNGERDFVFYRNPGADQLYKIQDLPKELLEGSIFHFCSVSLDDYPIKDAHFAAINYVRETNGFISFDPNLRISLWNDLEKYRSVINDFIPLSDLIKVSDDELEFITGIKDQNKAIKALFVGNVKYVILTLGKEGSRIYLNGTDEVYEAKSFKVIPVDTTGAGDAFIGTFLSELNKRKLIIDKTNAEEILTISNATAALVTTKYGGIVSIPNYIEVKEFIKNK